MPRFRQGNVELVLNSVPKCFPDEKNMIEQEGL